MLATVTPAETVEMLLVVDVERPKNERALNVRGAVRGAEPENWRELKSVIFSLI